MMAPATHTLVASLLGLVLFPTTPVHAQYTYELVPCITQIKRTFSADGFAHSYDTGCKGGELTMGVGGSAGSCSRAMNILVAQVLLPMGISASNVTGASLSINLTSSSGGGLPVSRCRPNVCHPERSEGEQIGQENQQTDSVCGQVVLTGLGARTLGTAGGSETFYAGYPNNTVWTSPATLLLLLQLQDSLRTFCAAQAVLPPRALLNSFHKLLCSLPLLCCLLSLHNYDVVTNAWQTHRTSEIRLPARAG